MKKLIDINELSKNLSVPVRTIYEWTSMKVIPFYKVGRSVRFDGAEMDQWLKERKQEPCKFAEEYCGNDGDG